MSLQGAIEGILSRAGLSQDIDDSIRKLQEERLQRSSNLQSVNEIVDKDYYSAPDRSQYVQSISATDGEEEEEQVEPVFEASEHGWKSAVRQYGAAQRFKEEMAADTKDEDVFKPTKPKTIAEREDEYRARRRNRRLSPPRVDPFSASTSSTSPPTASASSSHPASASTATAAPAPAPAPAAAVPSSTGCDSSAPRSYKEVMRETFMEREKRQLEDRLRRLKEEEARTMDREAMRAKAEAELRAARERKRVKPEPAAAADKDADAGTKRARPLQLPPGVHGPDYMAPPDAAVPPAPWRLFVFKRGTQLATHLLGDPAEGPNAKTFYMLGRCKGMVDIVLEHPSASKFHAVIQFRRTASGDVRPFLFDLASTHGTTLEQHALPPRTFTEVSEKAVFQFAGSSREYVLARAGP